MIGKKQTAKLSIGVWQLNWALRIETARMNDATNLIANDAKTIVQAHLNLLGEVKEHVISPELKKQKFAEIQAELIKRDAVLVAHYYCDP